jgi:hypothetical protein
MGIAFAVSALSRVCAAPTQKAWAAGMRVLRYLKHTRELGLALRKVEGAAPLEAFIDADWASDLSDRRSTSGYVVKFLGSTISWGPIKQKSVAISTTEAEYMARSEAAKDVIWVTGIIRGFSPRQVGNGSPHTRRQHLGYRPLSKPWTLTCYKAYRHPISRIRELFENPRIKVCYVATTDQTADVFTKPLNGLVHVHHRDQLLTGPLRARAMAMVAVGHAAHRAQPRMQSSTERKREKRREKRNNNPSPGQLAKQMLLQKGGICWGCKRPDHERKDCPQASKAGDSVSVEPPSTPYRPPTPPFPPFPSTPSTPSLPLTPPLPPTPITPPTSHGPTSRSKS